MRFSDKLSRVLDAANLSDREAAKRLGDMSPTTLGRWKTGETEPRLSDVALIARVFGVPISYLVDDSLDEPPEPLLSREEEQLLATARALNGGAFEALKRIVNFPLYVSPASHVELTDATLRREKEIMRPKRHVKEKASDHGKSTSGSRSKRGGR
jgi:transcriptional regulator with XRE-family HTH domain